MADNFSFEADVDLSIVVPLFNEEESVRPLWAAVATVLPSRENATPRIIAV